MTCVTQDYGKATKGLDASLAFKATGSRPDGWAKSKHVYMNLNLRMGCVLVRGTRVLTKRSTYDAHNGMQ